MTKTKNTIYKEVYYTIGNPFECDEDFMETAFGYFNTIQRAREEIKDLNRNYGCHKNEYEIAKITITIERIK